MVEDTSLPLIDKNELDDPMACAENQDGAAPIKTNPGLGPRPRNGSLQPRPVGLESKFDETRNVVKIVPLKEVEKQTILDALDRLNGNKLLTARALGIGKTTLYRKLKEYGVLDS